MRPLSVRKTPAWLVRGNLHPLKGRKKWGQVCEAPERNELASGAKSRRPVGALGLMGKLIKDYQGTREEQEAQSLGGGFNSIHLAHDRTGKLAGLLAPLGAGVKLAQQIGQMSALVRRANSLEAGRKRERERKGAKSKK